MVVHFALGAAWQKRAVDGALLLCGDSGGTADVVRP